MEEPFDSIRKMMSTINRVPEDERDNNQEEHILFSKGAPEKILEITTQIEINGIEDLLTEKLKSILIDNIRLRRASQMAYVLICRQTVFRFLHFSILEIISHIFLPPRHQDTKIS